MSFIKFTEMIYILCQQKPIEWLLIVKASKIHRQFFEDDLWRI